MMILVICANTLREHLRDKILYNLLLFALLLIGSSVLLIRLNREPAAAGDTVADIGRGKSDRRQQCHPECHKPDRPGGRCRHDVTIAPELRGRARQHDGEEIDGEPDGGEQ